MHAKQILALALSTGLGAAAFAVQGSSAAPAQGSGGLVRLSPGGQGARAQTEGSLDAGAWRARLTDADLDLREQAYEEALASAGNDGRLRSLLQDWARQADDAQLAWTSRLLLRELESSRTPFGLRGAQAFDLMGPGGGGWTMGGFEPEELFERLRAWQGGLPRMHGLGSLLPPAQGGASQPRTIEQKSESFQLSVGPDGARCEVTSEEDGEQVKRTFEAESLEQLLEQNPELRERIRLQGTLDDAQSWFPPFAGQVDPNVDAFGLFRGFEPQSTLEPLRTNILGVVAHPLGAEEARERGLEPGRGVVVERVEPGTIADALRIRRGHVLLELNGRVLRSRDDISAALAERSEDGELLLELLDRWGEPRSRVWKPVPDGAGTRVDPSQPRRF